jgi:hypothetical protein
VNIRSIRKKILFVSGLLANCMKNPISQRNTFKLSDIYYSDKKQSYLAVIELVDKGVSLIKPINEIVYDDNFICGFDPIDARTLGYMSCYEQLRKA